MHGQSRSVDYYDTLDINHTRQRFTKCTKDTFPQLMYMSLSDVGKMNKKVTMEINVKAPLRFEMHTNRHTIHIHREII